VNLGNSEYVEVNVSGRTERVPRKVYDSLFLGIKGLHDTGLIGPLPKTGTFYERIVALDKFQMFVDCIVFMTFSYLVNLVIQMVKNHGKKFIQDCVCAANQRKLYKKKNAEPTEANDEQ